MHVHLAIVDNGRAASFCNPSESVTRAAHEGLGSGSHVQRSSPVSGKNWQHKSSTVNYLMRSSNPEKHVLIQISQRTRIFFCICIFQCMINVCFHMFCYLDIVPVAYTRRWCNSSSCVTIPKRQNVVKRLTRFTNAWTQILTPLRARRRKAPSARRQTHKLHPIIYIKSISLQFST